MQLRIALLGYRSNPFSGGQGIYIRYLAHALKDLGHHVDVISGEPYPELRDDIPLIKLPGLNLYDKASPFRSLEPKHLRSFTDTFEWASMVSGGFPEPYTFGRRVVKYLTEHGHQYDVIHDNQSLSHGIVKLQRLGLPVVSTIHHPITYDRDIALAHEHRRGMRLLIKRWHHFLSMQTKVARELKHIVTVSECSKRDICSSFDVPAARVSVIYNGVDTALFKPAPNTATDALQLITTASADQPLKGTQHLIPAFAKLRELFPGLKLTFIGRPKEDGVTASLIKQHKLASDIRFIHGITSEQVAQLYTEASIAVVPSEYEGFGLPAAEAMACGVPVVATNGGALPEVLGDAGITVEKGSAEALVEGISRLIQNPTLRNTLALAGRKRMLEHFSWQTTAQEMTHYYQQVIQNES